MADTPTMRSQFEAWWNNRAQLGAPAEIERQKEFAFGIWQAAFLSSAKEPQTEGWRHRSEAAKDTDLTTGTKIQIKRPSGNVTDCSVGSQMWQMCLRYDDEMLAYRIAPAELPAPSSEGGEKPVGDGSRPLPFDRETLGRMVREAWVRWAQTHPAPKPSWLVPYDDLGEDNKEADRQIGEAVARWTLIGDAAALSQPEQQGGGAVGDAKEVLFFASYCDGDDGEECTAKRPCAVCLGMSNVHRIPAGTSYEYVRQFAPERNATPVSDPKDLEAELREAESPWRPIEEADRSIDTVQTFGDVQLRNSYPVWVRDEDGRTYEAVWSDYKGGHWWDLDGEDVADPVEFYPHPLARTLNPKGGDTDV